MAPNSTIIVHGTLDDQHANSDTLVSSDQAPVLHAMLHDMIDSLKRPLVDITDQLSTMGSQIDDCSAKIADLTTMVQQLINQKSDGSDFLPSCPVDPTQLVEALRKTTGYEFFRSPAQCRLVGLSLLPYHIIAILPTGMGKTLAFILASCPHLKKGKRSTIVVAVPYVRGVEAIIEECASYQGIRVATWDPETTPSNPPDVLVGTLETITSPAVIKWGQILFSQGRLGRLVIDETWTIITDAEWRRTFLNIQVIRQFQCPVTIVGATMTDTVIDQLTDILWLRGPIVQVRLPTHRPELRYSVHFTAENGSTRPLVEMVNQCARHLVGKERIIVYTRSVKAGQTLAQLIGCKHYHAKGDDLETTRNEWIGESGPTVITATRAFGPGNHYAHVRYLFHAGHSNNFFDWMQETGRAGRDQVPSEVILFINPNQVRHSLLKIAQPDVGGREVMLRGLLDPNQCIRSLTTGYFDKQTLCCSEYNASVLRCDRCKPIRVASMPLTFDTTPLTPAMLRIPGSSLQQPPNFAGTYNPSPYGHAPFWPHPSLPPYSIPPLNYEAMQQANRQPPFPPRPSALPFRPASTLDRSSSTSKTQAPSRRHNGSGTARQSGTGNHDSREVSRRIVDGRQRGDQLGEAARYFRSIACLPCTLMPNGRRHTGWPHSTLSIGSCPTLMTPELTDVKQHIVHFKDDTPLMDFEYGAVCWVCLLPQHCGAHPQHFPCSREDSESLDSISTAFILGLAMYPEELAQKFGAPTITNDEHGAPKLSIPEYRAWGAQRLAQGTHPELPATWCNIHLVAEFVFAKARTNSFA